MLLRVFESLDPDEGLVFKSVGFKALGLKGLWGLGSIRVLVRLRGYMV